MMHPIFYIKDIASYLPRNAAQQVMIMEVKKTQWLTLEDDADLDRYEMYLKKLAVLAHRLSPKSRKMVVEKYILTNGTRQFTVTTDTKKPQTVLIIDVTFIRGAWKGGLK